MIYPPNAIPMTSSQCIVGQPNFVALPCDDSVQQPANGRRIMQFNVHVSVASNNDSLFYDIDLSALNQSGFLDKYVSIEIDNLRNLYPNANGWGGNVWLMCDVSNQSIFLHDNQGIQPQIICDLLMPSSKISLQLSAGGVVAQNDEYYSIIIANYSRMPFLAQVS